MAVATGRVALGDIRDAEAFVQAAIMRSPIRFDESEFDDAMADGVEALLRLWNRYEPRRAGYETNGRFSGYAAQYLPRKIIDAWHRRHPEHVADRSNGKRRWTYLASAESYEALVEVEEPPGAEDYSFVVDAVSASIPTASSALVGAIRTAVYAQLQLEFEMTVRVAILRGMGFARPEIVRRLDSTDAEVRVAMERLRRAGNALDA